MKIFIRGKAPNAAMVLEAETQAEHDQIERLKREAIAAGADSVVHSYDPAYVLRVRVEAQLKTKP